MSLWGLRDQREEETDMEEEIWPTAEQRQQCIAQAKALRKQAATGGLRFDAYSGHGGQLIR